MLIKFPSGNKPDNDKLLLDQGFIVLDNESKGIRIHDGSTVGGFESIGVETPRPSEFLGEVPIGELISGDALASLVGLSAGTAINDNEPWLKFYDEVDQKTKFIARKTFRRNISWDDINAVDCVYGKEITIQGKQYICRLIKGANSDPYVGITPGLDLEGTWGSEWNRLMYPICAPTGNSTQDNITDPDFPGFNTWASYSQQELNITNSNANGGYSICQETIAVDTTRCLLRGFQGVGQLTAIAFTTPALNFGWRPLLELVE